MSRNEFVVVEAAIRCELSKYMDFEDFGEAPKKRSSKPLVNRRQQVRVVHVANGTKSNPSCHAAIVVLPRLRPRRSYHRSQSHLSALSSSVPRVEAASDRFERSIAVRVANWAVSDELHEGLAA